MSQLFAMRIPAYFLADYLAGKVLRYGCILKDSGTGRIVGHLVELGRAGRVLDALPLGPLSALARVAEAVATQYRLGKIENIARLSDERLQGIQQSLALSHLKSGEIQQGLNHLHLIGSIGAAASVAGLGVSVAGFALVLRRLDRLENSLNQGMDRLRAAVERVRLTLDMLQMAELRAAWELLGTAEHTDLPGRTPDLLQAADKTFQKYRNYYFDLITLLRPWAGPELSLPQLRELYGRYFACALAELEANFLLHDFSHWHRRHELICGQLRTAGGFSPAEAFQVRAHAAGLLTTAELQALREEAALTRDYCKENVDRIETAAEETKWLERRGIAPREYLQSLRAASEDGPVLVSHDE
jgi:hypothetical protein